MDAGGCALDGGGEDRYLATRERPSAWMKRVKRAALIIGPGRRTMRSLASEGGSISTEKCSHGEDLIPRPFGYPGEGPRLRSIDWATSKIAWSSTLSPCPPAHSSLIRLRIVNLLALMRAAEVSVWEGGVRGRVAGIGTLAAV